MVAGPTLHPTSSNRLGIAVLTRIWLGCRVTLEEKTAALRQTELQVSRQCHECGSHIMVTDVFTQHRTRQHDDCSGDGDLWTWRQVSMLRAKLDLHEKEFARLEATSSARVNELTALLQAEKDKVRESRRPYHWIHIA